MWVGIAAVKLWGGRGQNCRSRQEGTRAGRAASRDARAEAAAEVAAPSCCPTHPSGTAQRGDRGRQHNERAAHASLQGREKEAFWLPIQGRRQLGFKLPDKRTGTGCSAHTLALASKQRPGQSQHGLTSSLSGTRSTATAMENEYMSRTLQQISRQSCFEYRFGRGGRICLQYKRACC